MPILVRLADPNLGNHDRQDAPGGRGDKVAKPRHLEDEGAPAGASNYDGAGVPTSDKHISEANTRGR
eukprot:954568-Heterocapsa_arctica.AAC.1